MNFADTTFYVLDTETTGLSFKLDHIIELAIVKVKNGQVLGEWNSLFNPGIFVPQETTSITGITTETVQGAPKFASKVNSFLDFMREPGVVVAHNIEFDRPFLKEHLERLGHKWPDYPDLCTFKMAKVVLPTCSSYALGELCKLFKIDLPQAHRAIHDTRATANLLLKLAERLGNPPLEELPGVLNLKKPDPAVQDQVSLF